LEDLYRRNLFIISVDRHSKTYRYHDLFKEFLQSRLKIEHPELVNPLHLRAANAETVSLRVLRHLVKAQAWEEAAQTLEVLGEELLEQGSVGTLRYWIELLPPSVRDNRPRLRLYLGICAWMYADMDTARSHFDEAIAGFEERDDQAGIGESLAYYSSCVAGVGEYLNSYLSGIKALKYPLSPNVRVQVLLSTTVGDINNSNLEQAYRYWDEAFGLLGENPDLRTLYSAGILMYGAMAFLPDGKVRYQRYIELANQKLAQSQEPFQVSFGGSWEEGVRASLKAVTDMHTAMLYYIEGQVAKALQTCEEVLAYSELTGGISRVEMETGLMITHMHMLFGNQERANFYLERFRQRVIENNPDFVLQYWYPFFPYQFARAQIMQGKLDEATKTLEHLAELDRQKYLLVEPLETVLAGLLAVQNKRYADAEPLFLKYLDFQERVICSRVYSNARILLSHLYLQWQKPQQSLSMLAPLLLECSQNGNYGILYSDGVAIIIPLLKLAIEKGVYPQIAATALERVAVKIELPEVINSIIAVPGTNEMLTPREVEILQLLAAGKSNQDIADKLVISLHTVKRHVAHVLDKFGVESRTQVAAIAHEMKLV
jgi:LuxR family transcriptional regulator, maltose regulon positive regulatory protein